jgi:hypothetical protein
LASFESQENGGKHHHFWLFLTRVKAFKHQNTNMLMVL